MLEQKEALVKEGHRISNMKDLSEVIHQFASFPNDLLYVKIADRLPTPAGRICLFTSWKSTTGWPERARWISTTSLTAEEDHLRTCRKRLKE